MTVAPFCLARRNHLKEMGWFSAALEPMKTTTSALGMSHSAVVMAPRPNEVPRPGTVEECHIRAWCSRYTTPRARISLVTR